MIRREEILHNLRRQLKINSHIIGIAAGAGISAKYAERGGADFILTLNSGKFRQMGRSSIAGFLPYCSSNDMVMDVFLKQLEDMGFNGVQNFPTVGLIDGVFHQNLEETNMGYGLEVEMIRKAHALDPLTTPYVFNPEQAKAMAEAGADILVAHMDLTTKGSIGAKTALTLDDCAKKIEAIIEAGKSVSPASRLSATAVRLPSRRMQNM